MRGEGGGVNKKKGCELGSATPVPPECVCVPWGKESAWEKAEEARLQQAEAGVKARRRKLDPSIDPSMTPA